ncbi:MAG: hypothetical protein ACK5HT_04020, partial [Draconibacterium sp.]
MRKTITITLLLFSVLVVYSQNKITGVLTDNSNQKIKLVGYAGFGSYTIDSTQTNEKGEFKLAFTKKDYGMAHLISESNKPFVVILTDENVMIKEKRMEDAKNIEIIEDRQNLLFDQYASEHPHREQTLGAWDYLTKIYKFDTLFSAQQVPKHAIETEKKRIKAEDSLFLTNLPTGSYVSYYLPLRKLVSSVATIAQYRTEEIPETLKAFRKLDYTDSRLYKSGLLKDAIESHFWLIENSGRSLDSVYTEMQISIDRMLDNLMADKQ